MHLRPFFRVLVGFVIASLFSLGTVVVVSPTSSAAIIDGVSLKTSFSNFGIVAPGAIAQGTVTISNTSETDISDGVVNVIAVTTDVSESTALNDWLASDAPDRGKVLGQVDVGDVPAGQTKTTLVNLDAGAAGWGDTWGTRALLVTLEDVGGVVARTHGVVIYDVGLPPHAARLAVIAPVVAPRDTSATIDPKALEQATAIDGAFSRVTSVAEKFPLTLAIDPRIPASIVSQPDQTPAATAWWQTLVTLGLPAFATAYGDADLSAQIQAGATSFLSPGQSDPDAAVTSILGSLGPATSSVGTTTLLPATASPALSPTPAPSPPAESWWSGLSGTAWPAAGTLDETTMSALVTSGYERVIVSSGNLESSAVRARVNITGGLPAFITDDGLSGSMVRAASRDGMLDGDVADVLARLATVSTDPGSQHAVVAALSRDLSDDSVSQLDQLMNILAGVTWVDLVPLDSVADSSSGDTALRDVHEDGARLETVASLLERHRTVVDFSLIGQNPEFIAQPVTRQIMTTLGVGNMNTPRWSAAVDASTSSINRTLNGVHVATNSVINMIGGTASLPLSIENDLDTAVSVLVYAVPRNSRLTIDGGLPVKVESRAQAVAKLPAVAHVSNGSVFVDVSLTSEAGLPVGTSRPVSVEIHADWETIGLVVLAIVFLGLVSVGIFRTLRRRRVEVT